MTRTGAPARLGAIELVEMVVDAGSFVRWDTDPLPPIGVHGPADQGYLDELAAARETSGCDESVLTGEATLAGRRVALVLCEFGFLAGSIGTAAAERLVQAVEKATAEQLPLLASPTSGGTRMQEGTVAFLQMVKISAAIAAHKSAGLAYAVYLRHPTTGGALASWGSLGHVTAAEPGALLGFLGPRVYQALYGEKFPEGVQTAENLAARGLVDAVVPPEQLREVAISALAVLCAPHEPPPPVPNIPLEHLDDVPAWESIRRSRRPERPRVRHLVRSAANTVTTLQGTGAGEIEPGLFLALAKFGASACVLLGQDRTFADQPLGPAGLREARRGMRLAEELQLPLVTVIDTAGAALSKEAEEGGLAGEIARCLVELTTLKAPTICLLLGQGAGGGALALLPADRVLCAQHGWLSPLPPEGASAIKFHTTDRAAEMAEEQGVRSLDLLRNGVIDRIVAERPDASDEPAAFLSRLGTVLEHELAVLLAADPAALATSRLQRYRYLGMSDNQKSALIGQSLPVHPRSNGR
ncbi:acetyl-CoA carboxyl transferase [Rhodococcus fascians]|uniref:carboxyl transferase domain-containing protein n=1 Tax=Rhodococcoides fascians TaxID=1828 RepID=UPI00195F909B|nr:carboxyl transferase domain-containing protein [Rhodococcus fascians]MBM7245108.1 acetyl-CoA carboxylase carboxyltransferase subunit alpha/beta [Rhodococcus fascians]MBY3811143.1 acetyl-CoA carboxyl transferase [Rhodococcus fascians]MBY3842646.1 acetyl-CoA carboxyl transferase [Rhodococcus fascians]MBY3845555.1 acetyl-CoA carboxyl transferase [Rhodococcus fascians]MBY3851713.1 acetyl-CoA carboxyl transferase [Rhodococcus fascians]